MQNPNTNTQARTLPSCVTIAEYFAAYRGTCDQSGWFTPKAKIGRLGMSIQASSVHYCTPKNDIGPYTSFEIGFPSERIEDLMPYAEDADNPTETVYGRVPAAVIDKIIRRHRSGITPARQAETA